MRLEKRLTKVNNIKLRLIADVLKLIIIGAKYKDIGNLARKKIKKFIPTADEILLDCAATFAVDIQTIYWDNLWFDCELLKSIKK